MYGSYVHGIFDAPDVTKRIIAAILEDKGYDTDDIQSFNIEEYREKQYDALADIIRSSMDMKKIYEIIDRGV